MKPPPIYTTSWPGGPAVAIPDVETNEILTLGAERNVLVYGNPLPAAPVSDELLFGALFDFDCDDVDAIANFERAHGRLGTSRWASYDYEGEHFPPFVADRPASWTSGARVGTEAWRRARVAILHSEYPDQVSASDNMAFLEGWGDDTEVADWSTTARAVRACALHLEAHKLPDAERNLPRVWREQGFDVKDAAGAWRWFGIIVNERLDPFRMCVLVPGIMDERAWWGSVRLENALALQIRNYVIENASYRRCASETCGNVFALDVGGRKRRKFCSEKCGRRQSALDAKTRKKEQGR